MKQYQKYLILIFCIPILFIETNQMKASNDLSCVVISSSEFTMMGFTFRFRVWECTCTVAAGNHYTFTWYTIDYYGYPVFEWSEPQPRKGIHIDDALETDKSTLIYPNPAKNLVNIRSNLLKDISIKVNLYDNNMHLVENIFNGRCSSDHFLLSTNNMPSGIYFLIIKANNKIIINKQFIISK